MWLLSIMMILSVILITGTALGQKEKKTPGSPAQPAPEQNQTVTIKGKVSAVTDATLTVVNSEKVEQTIALDATTKILKGGKEVTSADLKANDMVEIVARKGEGDALTAIKITVA